MYINLELYRTFYVTAKSGSISKAARELFTSQPAVSQSIKSLEDKLGGQLFYRTPKGVSLTVEGEVLFSYIEKGYGLMQTAERKFLELKSLSLGELRIAVCNTICKYYLMDYLEEYNKRYPKIKIYVTDKSTNKIVEALESGEVDIGILNMNISKDKKHNLNMINSFTIQDCFVAGEKYSDICNKKMNLKELVDNYPIMLLEKGGNSREFIDNYFYTNGLTVLPEVELGSMELLTQFSKKGMGIACVVKNYVQKELKENLLYEVPVKEKIPQRTIGVVIKKGIPISSAAEKFIELINDLNLGDSSDSN